MEIVRKLRLQAMLPRLRRNEEERARFPDEADETMVLHRYDEGTARDEVVPDARDEPTVRSPRHRG
jgi:hypothetical protein